MSPACSPRPPCRPAAAVPARPTGGAPRDRRRGHHRSHRVPAGSAPPARRRRRAGRPRPGRGGGARAARRPRAGPHRRAPARPAPAGRRRLRGAAHAPHVQPHDLPERRGLRRARAGQGHPVPLAVPPPAPSRACTSVPARRADHRLSARRAAEMFAATCRSGAPDPAGRQLAQEHRAPTGVGSWAEHLCMSLRGVQVDGSRTVTSALHGLLRTDPRSRAEFFALATGTRP